jgi:hypothetical protein
MNTFSLSAVLVVYLLAAFLLTVSYPLQKVFLSKNTFFGDFSHFSFRFSDLFGLSPLAPENNGGDALFLPSNVKRSFP